MVAPNPEWQAYSLPPHARMGAKAAAAAVVCLIQSLRAYPFFLRLTSVSKGCPGAVSKLRRLRFSAFNFDEGSAKQSSVVI